ncbi:multidrug transporter [Halioglobus sp. HI00S01]|uniref:SapC family protein n=1 Tax=Halioglobus sp. HI00S01 TaxID=1822214 RepID=UPI0007C2C0F6|nr:SapC family protein [Halioglobus sp. HI00S01]KZX54958.1 multidrug transporter [Halioglobus sp. HI00S01]
MANPVPLDPAIHSSTRVRPSPELSIAANQQVLPVVVHEFAQLSVEFPLVFLKHAETGQFQAVALLGLAEGENLMLQDGKWLGATLPGALQMSPFKLLMLDPNGERVTVGIDPESPMVSETEGEKLFDEAGELTEFMQNRRKGLEEYYQNGQVTRAFVSLLVEKDLLVSQTLNMDIDGEKIKVDGIYLVSEAKLRELSDEDILDLNRRGFLQAIHAHLISLRQANRLARIRVDRKSGGPTILGL